MVNGLLLEYLEYKTPKLANECNFYEYEGWKGIAYFL